MIGEKQRQFIESAGQHVAPHIQAAIVQLAEAHDYARDVRADLWQYAVEIDCLTRFGLTANDLRWLVNNGYAELAHEVTKPDDATRKFQSRQKLIFTKRTCFVLTHVGLGLTTIKPTQAVVRRAA
jgi:hypothetical protein